MDAVDLPSLLTAISKGGLPAVILAVLFGLSQLVREVRGGKVGALREADLNAKIAMLEAQVRTLQSGMERMEAELERALDLVHSMRYQRDQARIRVELLEQLHGVDPRTVWPPEPQAITPASTSTAQPPVALGEGGVR